MKHYTVQLHTKDGAYIRHIGFDAESKSGFRKQVEEYNRANPETYVAIKTAFVLKNDFNR